MGLEDGFTHTNKFDKQKRTEAESELGFEIAPGSVKEKIFDHISLEDLKILSVDFSSFGLNEFNVIETEEQLGQISQELEKLRGYADRRNTAAVQDLVTRAPLNALKAETKPTIDALLKKFEDMWA
jgi:hypothetical protein